ncbi:YceI family protein [Algibacter sp.]|jgi:polyisoprenoid-binding protein YceI|nr:YceI family protein [Algibacter sp.]
MKRFLFFVICFCCLSLSFSQNKSSIDFVIRNVGIAVDGHFNTFNIETDFDNKGELLNIKGEIKVASIETGIESRDNHILKADYFDIENHENITWISKAINTIDDGVFTMIADLTIKGKTKEISITVNRDKINNKYKITSSFKINRRNFDVGGRSIVMSNTVKINVVHYHNL